MTLRIKNKIQAAISSLFSTSGGNIAIEFAFAFPIFLMLCIPAVNYFHYIITLQKVTKTTITLADMIADSVAVSESTKISTIDSLPSYITASRLQKILLTSDFLMIPQQFSAGNGAIIVSSIYKPQKDKIKSEEIQPYITWQVYYRDSEVYLKPREDDAKSIVGSYGTTAKLPEEFMNAMYYQENIIVVELSYTFKPIIPLTPGGAFPALGEKHISTVHYAPARNQPLRYLVPTFPPPGWPPPEKDAVQ